MKLSPRLRSLLVVCVLLCTQVIATQSHAQEVQVAFDVESDTSSTGKIFTINRELRYQLDLFPEHPGFEQANLYLQAPGRYSLEISVLENGRTSRLASALDSTQVAALRSDIRSRVSIQQPKALVDQSGRSHFLWTTAVAAFLYYGPALAANVGGGTGGVTASYLLGGSLGFFLPYALTERAPMTEGMAAAARVGAILGVGHTALAFGAADLYEGNFDGRTFTGVSSIVSAAELTAGVLLAKKHNVTAGRANLVGVGGVFGGALGVFSSFIVLGPETTPEFTLGSGLVGSLTGMYIANEVAISTNYTTGDAKAMMMGGLTGSFLTTAILTQVSRDVGDARILFGMLTAGTIGGCYATHKMLGKRNFSDGDGNLVILGTVVGGVVGAGLAVAAQDFNTAILAPAVGASAGFFIMMSSLGKGTEDRGAVERDASQRFGHAQGNDRQRTSTLLDRLDFDLNPVAIGMAIASSEVIQRSTDRVTSVPVARITLAF